MPFEKTTDTDIPGKNKSAETGHNQLISQGNRGIELTDSDLEMLIANGLEDESLKLRIRELLQEILREELSKMSTILREALRNWVFKEKKKYHLSPEGKSPDQAAEFDRSRTDLKQLEEENEKLKRALELKDHENKIMISAIKKLTPKPN